MISQYLQVFFKKGDKKNDSSSEFSKFFREASSREKKKVFLDIAKKASREQLEIMKAAGVSR